MSLVYQSSPFVLSGCGICSLDTDDIDFLHITVSCRLQVIHTQSYTKIKRVMHSDSLACLPAGLSVSTVKEKTGMLQTDDWRCMQVFHKCEEVFVVSRLTVLSLN